MDTDSPDNTQPQTHSMTRDQAKELLPVIAAYAEGKTVEFSGDEFEPRRWLPALVPTFNADGRVWRIKPEPREWWIGFCPIHGNKHAIFYSKPIRQCEACEAIHVREVIP